VKEMNKATKNTLKVFALFLGGIFWIFSAPSPTEYRLTYIVCVLLGSIYVFMAGLVAATAISESSDR